jgi:putative membrane-bound dehydrogenase-like protein
MPFRLAAAALLFAALSMFTSAAASAQDKPAASAKKKVVFVAGKPSHSYAAHEHNAGCLLLAKELQAAKPEFTCDTHHYGWPADAHFFDGADCIVMYCDGGAGHMVNQHLDEVDALAKKGVGIVCVHYGVEVPKGPSGDKFLDWIGGYFEMNWSVNPHWTANYEKFPDHPICRGVKPFSINDEWYYHMRFRDGMKGVTPILTALPPKESLSRPDGTHSGNPDVRAAVLDRNEPQHMAWAAEREGGGRGFGFSGGHDHWNWGDPNFRKVMLNAIVWCAHGEVPAGGVESAKLTMKDLESNLDPKNKPANFKREDIQQKLKLPPDDAKGAATPMQATPIAALQQQAQPQQPRQQGQRGGANGGRGRGAAGGIGAALSRLDLLRIEAVQKELGLAPDKLAALQKLQDAQGRAAATAAASVLPQREAASAVAGLDVADGLQATLFSSEPDISNITDIDIDHLGRVWACEVRNYRKHNGERPEGDRILVLEDKDGDGKCDQQTVFYQGRDIDSAHGICVLGNRVIVSALDKVQVFYDDNGDLKADEKRDVLFSGISGVQHDHGIHAFVFGPDGKLYFNFGNEGKQLKDKDGKFVVDQAGNEVANRRKPYQDGMVFRCNLDGSQLETLGWNFRNNWEVAVDSFGTLWQSDNDDDGNKAVRINYVMEFGNYGFKDEMTGAAWKTPRENLEKEIPLQHWHLNDPGVVPTMLLTGAGSPTGICVYEGRLLPKIFWDQVIHCDAGPNVCRAYVTTKDGAGYKAEMVNILYGARDNWFRPSDVCVAPDGSLFIADWYDPGVGGHNQQDVDRGRIFRVAPPGAKYAAPKFDFKTAAGYLAALESPNLEARYLAFAGLIGLGDKAHEPLESYIKKAENPRHKARALWALAKLPGEGEEVVELAIKDKNPDFRVQGVRVARELGLDVAKLSALTKDSAPEVRRELTIALRHSKSLAAAGLWADLAMQHDGQDRWYLEALGIGADQQWDAFLDAYLAKASEPWKTPAGRDILWRSRAKKTPELLVKIIKDPATKEADQLRYFRALDFLSGPEKEAALKSLVE